MIPDDREYAVAFVVPVNAKVVTLISAQPEVHEGFDLADRPIAGSIYINDALVVFEDVFICEETVYLKGESEFAGDIAYVFANFHRLSAETCRAVELELLAGAAILTAEYNDVDKAPI